MYMQERELALHSEGVKMMVASELPHFIGVDDDILSTGVVLYHLTVSVPENTDRLEAVYGC